jgi:hypothetical protein
LTELTVIEDSREALTALSEARSVRGDGIDLALLPQALGPLVTGREFLETPPQDVLALLGVLEHLPDRLAVVFCRSIARSLRPGGALVALALAPSEDSALVDRLLLLPTVRRTGEALHAVLTSAGLRVLDGGHSHDPLLVALGRRPLS